MPAEANIYTSTDYCVAMLPLFQTCKQNSSSHPQMELTALVEIPFFEMRDD
jgi:hypothetical protein